MLLLRMPPERKLGDIIGINIFVRVPILAALVVLVVALSAAYIWLPNYRDAINFIALALTAAAGLGGTFYLAESLRAQTAQQKEALDAQKAEFTQRDAHHNAICDLALKQLEGNEKTRLSDRRREAFSLVARWNSPELFYSRQVCQEALDAFRTGKKKGIDEYLNDATKVQNARHVLNFLEEVAIAKRMAHADEEVLSRSFAGLTIRVFNAFQDWITEHRNTIGRQKIWAEFEALYKDWHDR